MKAFGDNYILKSGVMAPMQMLQYPMSLPISIQVTGIDGMDILHQALEAARTYTPPSAEAREALLARSAAIGRTGTTELYKISTHFDGTVRNPQWLTES